MPLLGIAFWQALVATLLGVFLAEFLALRARRHYDAKDLRTKKREVVRLLRSAIERDKIILQRMRDILKEAGPPSQRVFPSHYAQALYLGGVQVFWNSTVWGHLANIPPMLDHVNRRADDLGELAILNLRLQGVGPSGASALALVKANEKFVREELLTVSGKADAELDRLLESLNRSRAGDDTGDAADAY